MKVISCNLGAKTALNWRGKTVYSGIIKKSIDGPLFLEKEDVKGDNVVDRKYHGGPEKACYIYGANNYPHWENLYPDLNWHYGFLGENITLEHLDESTIYPGDIYQLGNAIICITDPREPCYKLGIICKDQKVLKQFRAAGLPGTYTSVIQNGAVKLGDEMKLAERTQDEFSLRQVFLFRHNPPATKEEMLRLANNPNLPRFSYKKWPIKIDG